MDYDGASRESVETRFCDHLVDDEDTTDSVRHKIDLLFRPFNISSYDGLGDGQLSISPDHDSHLSLLTPEQHSVASKIIKVVLHEIPQLVFLQGSAGTGKTSTVKALINVLQSHGKKCSI
jgi:predicted ribonuclease YlaK